MVFDKKTGKLNILLKVLKAEPGEEYGEVILKAEPYFDQQQPKAEPYFGPEQALFRYIWQTLTRLKTLSQ